MIHGYGPNRRGSRVNAVTPTILISIDRAWRWLIRTLRSGARETGTIADGTVSQEQELFAAAEGLSGFVRFATPFDMSGSPTITLPGGFTRKGLPLSFQLVSRHLEEALLVRAGHAYQQVTDWHHRHPPL